MASHIPGFFAFCGKASWDPGELSEMVASTRKDVRVFTIGLSRTSTSNTIHVKPKRNKKFKCATVIAE